MGLLANLKRRWGAQKRLDILHQVLVMDLGLSIVIQNQRTEATEILLSFARRGKETTGKEIEAVCRGRKLNGTSTKFVKLALIKMNIYCSLKEE